ncbi:hypothetical protein BDV12DRAFT_203355 [Aspergillus spectabilis]
MDLLARTEHPDNAQIEDLPSKPRSVALGLTRTYASDWKVKDALRELYQNWKDAILQTHAIPLEDFMPIHEFTLDEITIIVKGNTRPPVEAGGPMSQNILGYIRFNKIQGSAEFTNFGSSLDDHCLEMGTTTKSKDDRLIGGHGEGLKIAALVLCRENHHVKISANGWYWNFGFNGLNSTNFYCRLTPAKAKRAPAARLTARVREDVSVLVEKGHTVEGRRLRVEDFGAWMRETLDLQVHPDRIRTPSGDLLLGPMYNGHIYLKGIRVPQADQDRPAFYFGYNLLRGNVDRDRQRLVDGQSITETIHAIWDSAIANEQLVVLPRYIKLLRHHSTSADAIGADRFITEETAKKVWTALSWEARVDDAFYYQESHQIEHESMIRTELKKQPRPLPEVLWRICRQFGLIREPMEELQHQFQNSKEVELPDTKFAYSLVRTLCALLTLNPRTATIRVVFVHCDLHTVDLAYSAEENMLYVHEKWLWLPTPFNLEEPEGSLHMGQDAFICQHVVKEIYRRTLAIVFSQNSGLRLPHDLGPLLETSYQKLRQMPRMIEASVVEEDTALRISFYTGHSHAFVALNGSRVHYLVALHKAGCSNIVADLVYRRDHDVCDCPRATVPLSSRAVIFRNLDNGPWIPMVVKRVSHDDAAEDQGALKAQDGALIGLSSQVNSPSHRNDTTPASVAGAGHDVLPDGPIPGAPLDIMVKEEENGRQGQQITGKQSSADSADMAKVSPMMEVGDIHSMQMDLSSTGTPVGPTYDLNHPTTATSEQITNHFQPIPLPTLLAASAAVHGSIDDVGYEPKLTDAPTREGALNDMASLAQPSRAQRMPSGDSAWWRIWDKQCQTILPTSSRNEEEDCTIDGPWQLCDQYEQFSKGTYIQANIARGSGACSADHQVLFIHNILKPAGENRLAPSLVVTRYTFLVDYLAVEGIDTPVNQELLLHFHDADHMAEECDAEIIAVEDVTVVDAESGPITVSLIDQAPEPVTGFFARFAACDSSPPESLFITPLAPYLFQKDRPTAPRFSPFPVASVFDLSPGDTGLSIAFAQAGYRICAAVGFDEERHQSWKVHHPNAVVYRGDTASVIADLDSQRVALASTGEFEAPRIVVISGGRMSLALGSDMGGSGTSHAVNLVANDLEPFTLCDLVARSPVVSPDFIVLTLFVPSICHRQQPASWLTRPVANTINSLLARGYSINFRSLPHVDSEQMALVLLAAPSGTHSQWIDNILSDLHVARASQVLLGDTPSELHGQTGPETGTIDAVAPSSAVITADPNSVGLSAGTCYQIHESLLTKAARDITAIISRVIGEFSKHPQGPCSSGVPGELEGAQALEGALVRVKRRKI